MGGKMWRFSRFWFSQVDQAGFLPPFLTLGSNQFHIQFTGHTSTVCQTKRMKKAKIQIPEYWGSHHTAISKCFKPTGFFDPFTVYSNINLKIYLQKISKALFCYGSHQYDFLKRKMFRDGEIVLTYILFDLFREIWLNIILYSQERCLETRRLFWLISQ